MRAFVDARKQPAPPDRYVVERFDLDAYDFILMLAHPRTPVKMPHHLTDVRSRQGVGLRRQRGDNRLFAIECLAADELYSVDAKNVIYRLGVLPPFASAEFSVRACALAGGEFVGVGVDRALLLAVLCG